MQNLLRRPLPAWSPYSNPHVSRRINAPTRSGSHCRLPLSKGVLATVLPDLDYSGSALVRQVGSGKKILGSFRSSLTPFVPGETLFPMRWNLSHSYLDLPELLYTRQKPTPVAAPRMGVFNYELAEELGLEEPADDDLAILGGNQVPPDAHPFAQAYAGHQYAHFTMLGDGRALVLGEHRGPDGRLHDLQLKGSGPTPYSRSGDGRAALGPMFREYLMGEAMHALAIPSTRALAVVETGEQVWRETPLSGAVLTRVAHSHLRVGTFEFVAATEDRAALQSLTEYAIARHYPQAAWATNPAGAFLEAVIAAQARLVAQWMAVGFVHGVMNTDNMAISGQTIDYGPCAFLDTYRAGQVFSSIDRRGRYAYGNQPGIAQWNLTRLAEALLPLIDPDQERAVALAEPMIQAFADQYRRHYYTLMATKLGLEKGEGKEALVDELLVWMEETGADYTSTFRALTDTMSLPAAPEVWLERWRASVIKAGGFEAALERMATNPVYIPRNHKVQQALDAAEAGDYAPFHALVELLKSSFTPRRGFEGFAAPPSSETTEPFVTYCGT